MSNTVKVVCPCCTGSCKDNWFGLTTCITCKGTGNLDVKDPMGTTDYFQYKNEKITVEDFEVEEHTAKDIWDWCRHEFRGENWWKAHATIPVLESIEKILLDRNEIQMKDIPGGPNAPKSAEMRKLAEVLQKELEAFAKEVKKQAMAKEYTPYQGKEATQRTEETLREKIRNAAAEAQKSVKKPRVAVEFEPEKITEDQTLNDPTETITEETPMSSNVTDRLKRGGRTIVNSAKDGAILGTVNAANAATIDLMLMKLGDKAPPFLHTEAGRTLLKVMIPAAITMACEVDEGNKIPGKEYVQEAARLALMGTSAEAISDAMEFLLTNGFSLLQLYAEAGREAMREDTPAIGETAITVEEEEEVRRAAAKQREAIPEFISNG